MVLSAGASGSVPGLVGGAGGLARLTGYGIDGRGGPAGRIIDGYPVVVYIVVRVRRARVDGLRLMLLMLLLWLLLGIGKLKPRDKNDGECE